MAVYVTKKCPHCGFSYQILKSGNQHFYGSPFKVCLKCGKKFVDKDAIEIAISGIREYDKFKFSIGWIINAILGMFSLWCGTFDKELGMLMTIVGLIFIVSAIYFIYDEIKGHKNRLAQLEEEKRKSYDRLADVQYALKLKKLGYDVPEKFLTVSDKGDINKENPNEKDEEKIVDELGKMHVDFIAKHMQPERRKTIFNAQRPQDDDFGVSERNPICMYSSEESRKYLSRLRTTNGEKLYWIRQGSTQLEEWNGIEDVILNIYNLYCNGQFYEKLYICPYSNNTTYAPKGFKLDTQEDDREYQGDIEKEAIEKGLKPEQLIMIKKLEYEDKQLKEKARLENALYCRMCGAKLPSDSKYCLSCGTKVVFENT